MLFWFTVSHFIKFSDFFLNKIVLNFQTGRKIKMNSTKNNQTSSGNSIYSFELIPYLILNTIGIIVGAFGKIKIKNKFFSEKF